VDLNLDIALFGGPLERCNVDVSGALQHDEAYAKHD
jgi:hypothetical protein|tara:strand:- start:474 stop:581 length:108 start_codon:yes stop_codon:yes gene_type:complete